MFVAPQVLSFGGLGVTKREVRREVFAHVDAAVIPLYYTIAPVHVHAEAQGTARHSPGRLLRPALSVTGVEHDSVESGSSATGVVLENGIVLTAGHFVDPYLSAIRASQPATPSNPPPFALITPRHPVTGRGVKSVIVFAQDIVRSREPGLDLAAIRFDFREVPESFGLGALQLSPDPLHVGDRTGVCGFSRELRALGSEEARASFDECVVSALIQDDRVPVSGLSVIRVNTHALPGMSGGPVFDLLTGALHGILVDSVTVAVGEPRQPMREAVGKMPPALQPERRIPLGFAHAIAASHARPLILQLGNLPPLRLVQ